jgi:hypothetical protein
MLRGYKSGVLTGLLLSAGAALIGPAWRPALARWGRPMAKGAVKGGLATYEVARGRLAEFGEKAQDLIAEAQIERATERLRETAPGETGPASSEAG